MTSTSTMDRICGFRAEPCPPAGGQGASSDLASEPRARIDRPVDKRLVADEERMTPILSTVIKSDHGTTEAGRIRAYLDDLIEGSPALLQCRYALR